MKKKIFLADDSITIQKVVELTFSEGDYEVVCVGNGAAAMQTIGASSPDIALLDVIMPEQSGYEICAQIKKHPELAWMPVLLLTGAFEPYDEKRARESGADGHMTKPFESRALTATVERLLTERPRPGSAAVRKEATQTAAMESAAAPPPGASASSPAPARPEQTVRMKSSQFPPPATQPLSAPGRAETPPPSSVPRSAPPISPAPPASSSMSSLSHATPRPAAEPRSPGRGAEAAAANGGSSAVTVPPDVIARAVREAVNGISEKIVREVAWEVIPDLAEAIIRKRIRELEEEAER